MLRAYGSQWIGRWMVDGLKSIPTTCFEPTALDCSEFHRNARYCSNGLQSVVKEPPQVRVP